MCVVNKTTSQRCYLHINGSRTSDKSKIKQSRRHIGLLANQVSHRVLDPARLLVAVNAHPQLHAMVHFEDAFAATKRAAHLMCTM